MRAPALAIATERHAESSAGHGESWRVHGEPDGRRGFEGDASTADVSARVAQLPSMPAPSPFRAAGRGVWKEHVRPRRAYLNRTRSNACSMRMEPKPLRLGGAIEGPPRSCQENIRQSLPIGFHLMRMR